MNKGVIIGVISAIIIGIIGVTSLNFEASDNSVVEDIVGIESIPTEEIISEEEKGRELSVDLTESVGLQSP